MARKEKIQEGERKEERDTSVTKCEIEGKKKRMGVRSVPRGLPVWTKTLLGRC